MLIFMMFANDNMISNCGKYRLSLLFAKAVFLSYSDVS